MLFKKTSGKSDLYNKIYSDWHYKEWLEALWSKYKDYAPSNFKNTFSSCDDEKFNALIWEMILSCRFLEKGFKLEMEKEKIADDDRPDICVKHNGWQKDMA